MSSLFSKKFCGKNPLKNVEKPAKPVKKPESKPMSDSEKKLMHATQSVTDKSIKEQEYPGKVGVIIGEGAPEMRGGYEGGGDIAGAYYVPTGQMYADMFAKIGQAVADIDANKKKKEEDKKKKNIFSGFSTEEKSEEKTESMFNPDGTLKKSASERAKEI